MDWPRTKYARLPLFWDQMSVINGAVSKRDISCQISVVIQAVSKWGMSCQISVVMPSGSRQPSCLVCPIFGWNVSITQMDVMWFPLFIGCIVFSNLPSPPLTPLQSGKPNENCVISVGTIPHRMEHKEHIAQLSPTNQLSWTEVSTIFARYLLWQGIAALLRGI